MQFVARVGTPDGRVLEEEHDASDEVALRSELDKRGYHIFELRRRGISRKALPSRMRGGKQRRRIPDDDFLVFNQELAALLKAGLPLLQALDLMLERMHEPRFKSVLTEIRDRVKSGEDLSEAFADFGNLFPRLYPSSLKAGERSGELEAVIRRFIRYMKLVLDARKKVISALIYPAVLVGLSIAMIIVMAVYVVPKFQTFFQDLDIEKLPLLTRITLGISRFANARTFLLWNWMWLLLAIGAGIVFLRRMGETTEGRVAIDRFKLRLPLIGSVLHRFALSEFSRSLATLLSGGIPLVPAFEIAVSAVGNAYVRRLLEPTIQMVREGKPFHVALEKSSSFTDMTIDMVKVGEATGSLDEMLASVSEFLDEQVEVRMGRLLSLVEPIMLVVMGIIIAMLLISIYLPMFSMLGQTQT